MAQNFNPTGEYFVTGYAKFSSESDAKSNLVHNTCFALLALLINRNLEDNFEIYQTQILKSINYVKGNMAVDNYAASICAYAFALANEGNEGFINALEKEKVTDSEITYWQLNEKHEGNQNIREVIAGYVARAYLHVNDTLKAKPIIKWLIKQRNANGGFSGTYSNVVCMEALSAMAMQFNSAEQNMKIKIENKDGTSKKHHINSSNALELKLIEMPKNTLNVTIEAEGTGYALISTYYEFTKTVDSISNYFDLQVTPSKANKDELKIISCVTKKNDTENDQIMMEFSLSSGYVFMAEKSDLMNKKTRGTIFVSFIYF